MDKKQEEITPPEEKPWIGVDFDGTLAYYDGWKGAARAQMGEPIPRMMKRMLEWLENGERVKIFTARAADPSQIPDIAQWLKDNGLPDLEITCQKDFFMREIWDDRAVQVESNTGLSMQEKLILMVSFMQ
jgi:TusA-related sulfurtransferase